MPIKWVVDISGWIGAVSLLMAYGLVSMRRLDGNSVLYQAMNMLGGGFLIVNSFYYGAYPSVGVNGIWIAIGIFTLIQNWKRGKRPGKKKDKGGRLKTEGLHLAGRPLAVFWGWFPSWSLGTSEKDKGGRLKGCWMAFNLAAYGSRYRFASFLRSPE